MELPCWWLRVADHEKMPFLRCARCGYFRHIFVGAYPALCPRRRPDRECPTYQILGGYLCAGVHASDRGTRDGSLCDACEQSAQHMRALYWSRWQLFKMRMRALGRHLRGFRGCRDLAHQCDECRSLEGRERAWWVEDLYRDGLRTYVEGQMNKGKDA